MASFIKGLTGCLTFFYNNLLQDVCFLKKSCTFAPEVLLCRQSANEQEAKNNYYRNMLKFKQLLMKSGKRSVMLVSLLLLAMVTFAVPAKPGIKRLLTLTDGTTVSATLVGDEHAHYWLGEDGRAYQSAEDGVYQSVDLKAVKQRAAVRRSAANQRRVQRLAPKKVGTVGSITGDKKGIIILVNFKDKSFTATQSDFNKLANQVNYNSGNYKGSMYDYFYAQSDGQFRLTFDVVGPYTVSQNCSYYGGNDSEGNDEHPAEMVIEAIKLADADVNFADYDWDGDKIVDQVYVVYAGKGEADGGADNTIWPHEYDLNSAKYYGDGAGPQTLDGVKINTYACGGEQNGSTGATAGIGTMCHEFSHCLGYPDFYDTDYSGGQGMFSWDLMDNGSYNGNGYRPAGYTSYERWVAGWKTPTELVNTQSISNMKALQTTGSDTYIIYNKGNSNEYYLLENRQKTGWDTDLPGAGLLILHVDYSSSAWSNNTPNDDPSHQRMTWVPADNEYQYTTYKGTKYYTEAGAANDPFPYGNINAFGKTTTPAATLYNKNSDNTYYLDSSVENITQNSDGTISFLFRGLSNVEVPTFSPNGGTYDYGSSVNVTISCGTSDASIYYTTDGTDPTTASTQYTGALTFSTYTVLKAIAEKDGETSGVASATFKFNEPMIVADESLVFSTYTGTQQTKQLEVLSENLTQDITLTLNDANNVFSLGSYTISKDDEYATVDVVFTPTTAGTYTGTITLTSQGAPPVTVGLTATAKEPSSSNPNTTTFKLVSSVNDLEAGMRYIIGCGSAEKAAGALSSQILASVSVTVNNDVITKTNDVAVFVLEGNQTDGWTFKNESSKQYLYATAVKKLAYGSTENTWTLSDGTDGVIMTYSTSSYGTMLCNNTANSERFTTYTSTPSTTMIQANLYMEYDDGTTPVTKQDVTMAFSPTSASATMGESFTAPTLTTDPDGLTVTYSSSNTNVATVNSSTGAVTLVAAGETTITATFAGNDSYNNGSASYTLTVSAASSGSSNEFALVTSASDFVEGDYIIVYDGVAMNTTVSSNRLQYTTVTPANNVITTDDATIIWHIAPSGNYYTIYNVDESKYAASNGTKNQAQLLADGTDDKSLWSVTTGSTFDFTNKYNSNKSVNATLRRNTTYGFACYATGTGGALSLYKRTGGTTPVTTVAAPTITGTTPFDNSTTVTITAETGASIYYTLDGSKPSASSTLYSAPFTLSATTTVKAIAVKDNVSSAVTTQEFVRNVTTFIAYYQPANGKKGSALKTAMCGIIYNRTEKSYDYLWTAFQTTDVRSDGKIWDMYSNITNYTPVSSGSSYSNEGDCYNREHSFPQSWFNSAVPMYTDLHHIYPTDGFVNGKRSNYPFGETSGGTYKSANDFSKLGACTYSGYTGTVFEPADEYKGDFARTYFYMITCYEEKLADWYAGNADGVRATIDGSKYPGFTTWQLAMLMTWAKNDPVSEKETARNNAVYTIQNNRNPFIDYPGLEEYIWGSMTTTAFDYDNYVRPTYKQDVTMSFSPATATATIGESFTEPTLTINPTGLIVTYSSSDTNVATVNSSSGVVTLVAAGTTTITATFAGNDTYNEGTASYTLTVSESSNPISLSNDFALVTSAADFVEGDYIIVYDGVAMNTTVSSERLQYTIVTPTNNVITTNDAAIIWHIAPSGNYYTIYNAGENKYAASTGAKNKSQLLADGTDDMSLWSVTTGSTFDFTNKKNTSSGVNATLRRNTTYGFACYSTQTGGQLSLYKRTSNTAPQNTAPVWSALPTNASVYVGQVYELTVSDYVTGTPAPTITLASTNANTSDYDFEDGFLIFEPSTVGSYTFTFTATNSEGSTNATLSVTATGTAPSWSNEFPTTATMEVGDNYSLNVAGYVSGDPTPNINCTTDATSADYSFENGNLEFNPSTTGTYTFTFTATNSIGNSAATLTITVTEAPTPDPVIGSGNYALVTDATTLAEGDKILIAYVDGSTAKTMSATQSNNNRGAVDVTKNNDGTLTPGDAAQIITLEKDGNNFLFNVGNGYLYAASSGSNLLRTEINADNNAKATISISNGEATIVFQGSNTRNTIRYNPNNNNPIFACYASTSTTGSLPKIYREVPIPSITLNNNGTGNADAITANNGKMANVTLADRTLYKDGDWNTLCLPFALNSLDGTPLEGATVKTLNSASFSGGTLTLNFSNDLTSLDAGTPYIVKWTEGTDITNPVFSGVTISNANSPVTIDNVITFQGITSSYAIAGEDKTKLFLGAGNTLYYPNAAMTIGACRAYFQLADGIIGGNSTSAGDIKSFILNFGDGGADGISEYSEYSKYSKYSEGWYDLSGRRIEGKPTSKGIYVNNGKKIIIK